MTMTWHHIPEQRDLMLPEQWQCRAGPRSVAAVMRCQRQGTVMSLRSLEWQAVLQGPDGTVGSMMLTGASLSAAQAEVEMSLRDMGWREEHGQAN